MAAVERNSDGSYDAVDSGGFGKDYHGQDAFGERIGGTGIGGSHFGGFEEGHVGLDKDNTGHYEKLSSEALAQTESMPKSAFEADNSNESEEEASSGMRDSLRDLNSESSEENSKVSSLDTSFQIGEDEDEKAKSSFTDKMEPSRSEESIKKDIESINKSREKLAKNREEYQRQSELVEKDYNEISDMLDKATEARGLASKFGGSKGAAKGLSSRIAGIDNSTRTSILGFAKNTGYDLTEEKFNDIFAKQGVEGLRNLAKDINDKAQARMTKAIDSNKATDEKAAAKVTELENRLKSSFTDKMEESKEEAKAGPNMSKASVGESEYLTKANKDSTKEVPKEAPSRNDFGNHATDTLKGVVDRIADNTTAKALGIQSLEDFAKENGYDPEKLSTMKAYQSYQNKQIMKAIPTILKKVGGYIVERIKDAVDPSQLPERIRNTLARYNAATLVGAAILSIQSGAGIQAAIDQALTMVDPEDQPAVSDYLEDVLNDEGTVADLSNAFDDALAPEQNSDTAELDESIVNIGRKDNTDYSDFNAGLGTTSDADVKVFIARNVKADPILRRMISKMGK